MHDSIFFVILKRSTIITKSKGEDIDIEEFFEEVQYRDLIKVRITGQVVYLSYIISKAE